MRRLQPKYPEYTAKNVVLSGTHTHSGPGGYLQYVLYIVTSKGWVQQSFDALVEGIVKVTNYYINLKKKTFKEELYMLNRVLK